MIQEDELFDFVGIAAKSTATVPLRLAAQPAIHPAKIQVANDKGKDPSFRLERGVFYSRRRDIAEATGKATIGVSRPGWAIYESVRESIRSYF